MKQTITNYENSISDLRKYKLELDKQLSSANNNINELNNNLKSLNKQYKQLETQYSNDMNQSNVFIIIIII